MYIYPCWSTIAFGVWSVENSSWSLASVHTTMTVNGQLHSPFRYQNVQLLRRLSKTKQRSEDISSSQQSQFTVFNYEEDQTDCTWHCWELTDVFEKKKKSENQLKDSQLFTTLLIKWSFKNTHKGELGITRHFQNCYPPMFLFILIIKSTLCNRRKRVIVCNISQWLISCNWVKMTFMTFSSLQMKRNSTRNHLEDPACTVGNLNSQGNAASIFPLSMRSVWLNHHSFPHQKSNY